MGRCPRFHPDHDRLVAIVSLFLLAIAGCNDRQPAADVAPVGIGSVGPEACSTDEPCRAQCEEYANTVATPRPEIARFTTTLCKAWGQDGRAPKNGCECRGEHGGTYYLHPDVGCAVAGRGLDCLYHGAEFSGCSTAKVTTSCQAACDEVASRLDRDNQTALEVAVHGAVCSRGGCFCAVRIGERCHLRGSLVAQNCALSVGEIARRDEAARAPDGGAPGTGASPNVTPPGEQRQVCETSQHCGLALACKAGFCDRCVRDADCAPGEGCSLGTCLRAGYIGCRSNADCKAEEGPICQSNGLTGGYPRANEATVARCVSERGGISQRGVTFRWDRAPAGCATGADCSESLTVGARGEMTWQAAGDRRMATMADSMWQKLVQFLTDRQTTWPLLTNVSCASLRDRETVTITSPDGTVTKEITRCDGPPFETLRHWVLRLRGQYFGLDRDSECAPQDWRTCTTEDRCQVIHGTRMDHACAVLNTNTSLGCIAIDRSCDDALTWAHRADRPGELWRFPNSCIPTGWVPLQAQCPAVDAGSPRR